MGSTPNVLIIESNHDIREFISMALMDEGYEISAAPDMEAAFGLISNCDPDVILLDMFAPNGADPAFVNAYHERPGPHAPVIVLTTQSQPDRLAAELHADGFLSKPFHLNDLLELVMRYTTCPTVRKPLITPSELPRLEIPPVQ